MMKYNCNYSDFNIKLHNENYHYYCEVIIEDTGKIHYAHPSHTMFLENKVCKQKNITRGQLAKLLPRDRWGDYLSWLMEQTNCICVWYEFYQGKPNKEQIESLKKLIDNKCVDFEIN